MRAEIASYTPYTPYVQSFYPYSMFHDHTLLNSINSMLCWTDLPALLLLYALRFDVRFMKPGFLLSPKE